MDNGPARSENISKTLQVAGEKIADPIEISTLRREDFHFNKEKSEVAELLSCNNLPSSRTRRGHQGNTCNFNEMSQRQISYTKI